MIKTRRTNTSTITPLTTMQTTVKTMIYMANSELGGPPILRTLDGNVGCFFMPQYSHIHPRNYLSPIYPHNCEFQIQLKLIDKFKNTKTTIN